ncbi:hypothetical protein [Sphingomonas phyllosphaerae]|uniref:hypothetical protein n=1 Tax=Sphingomonas phyllosphaerae TaxID=257003 RepID=UPI002FFBA7F4
MSRIQPAQSHVADPWQATANLRNSGDCEVTEYPLPLSSSAIVRDAEKGAAMKHGLAGHPCHPIHSIRQPD